MNELVNLLLQGIVVAFVMISQSKHRNAGNKVQVFFSVIVVQINTVALVQYNLVTVVGVKQFAFRLVDIFLHRQIFCHNFCSFPNCIPQLFPAVIFVPFLIAFRSCFLP